MSRCIKHLLFDNDGTVVDSEIIGQRVMIDLLATYGLQISAQEYSKQFPGLVYKQLGF